MKSSHELNHDQPCTRSMFADKIESEKSKTRKRQPPPPPHPASTAVLMLLISVSFSLSLHLSRSILQAMIIASARLSVAFDWGIGGLLLLLLLLHLQFLLRSISSSFFAPLLPQLVIGDCNFVGLVGIAYSLAWLGLALLSLDCLFSVTFRISFHVIARAWQQFQLGPSF